MRYYPEALIARYGSSLEGLEEAIQVFDEIGRRRGCIMKGGNIDYTKTAKIILDDFRSGRLGAITLEHVPTSAGQAVSDTPVETE